MMKYKDNNDDVLMVEEEFENETVGYDESEDMFSEAEFSDYDINSLYGELSWGDS